MYLIDRLLIVYCLLFLPMQVWAENDQLTLTIASSNNFPPINFLEDDNLTGFGKDLSDAVMDELDIKIKRRHSSNWTEVTQWLETGQVDLIHDTGFISEREKTMDFSTPIIEMSEVIFTLEHRRDIHTQNSLTGKTVACVRNHITHIYLKRFPDIKCDLVNTPVEGLYRLVSGDVDAFIFPQQVVEYYSQTLRITDKIKIVGQPFRKLSWSMTVKKGNTQVLNLINEGLLKIRKNGTYDRIYNKWFGQSLLNAYNDTEVKVFFFIAIIVSILIGAILVLIIYQKKIRYARSALQKSNQLLVKSEKHFRELLNSTGEGIYGIDLQGDCTFINHACLTLLSYDNKEDVIGKNMHDLIHHHYPDGRLYPVEQCHIFKAFQEGKGTTIDNEVLWRKDGSSFPVEYRSFPIFENNKTIGAVVSFIDISERISAQETIRASEEKYRLAMEATQDGLWDWNILKGDVYYSPGWGRILKESHIENNYSSWESRIHQEDKERILDSLQQHLNGESTIWQQEHRLLDAKGDYRWVVGRGQVVKRDSDGKPLRMIGSMTDINEKKVSEEVIWHQANYDSLTQLPNRKLFKELLNNEIKLSKRNKEQLWLMFLDLDGFKDVNDTLGHDIGDEVLIQVSLRVQDTIRSSDTVARLGGDEFVIMLTSILDLNDVDQIAESLIEAIGQDYKLKNNHVSISGSIGISNYPNDAENAEDLLKFADQSMYEAKKEGKNSYSYFTSSLQHGFMIRKQMAGSLRNAIADNEFELYYQPIIDLNNDSIYKAETLIRWQHPERGLINPAGFIQIAEETGIICDLGILIFNESFNQLLEWKTHINSNLQLSINMSPLQLRTKEMKYDRWLEKLDQHEISGNDIIIEITEGILLMGGPVVNKRLLQYRDCGIQVAIDDFGTGYSSLSYLLEFDIDYLKIDQSFVKNLVVDSKEESIVEAIIAMAHKLGLKVIAEGIETEQQLSILKSMGCDFGQGYYIAKPLPAVEFTKLLSKHS